MQSYDGKGRRLVVVQGLTRQIGELDREIELLSRQCEEVADARRVLERIEATLRRMSMLAREALRERRPGLEEEFEECRNRVQELSDQAVLYGVNLVKDRGDIVRALIQALTDQIK